MDTSVGTPCRVVGTQVPSCEYPPINNPTHRSRRRPHHSTPSPPLPISDTSALALVLATSASTDQIIFSAFVSSSKNRKPVGSDETQTKTSNDHKRIPARFSSLSAPVAFQSSRSTISRSTSMNYQSLLELKTVLLFRHSSGSSFRQEQFQQYPLQRTRPQ